MGLPGKTDDYNEVAKNPTLNKMQLTTPVESPHTPEKQYKTISPWGLTKYSDSEDVQS